MPNQLNVIQFSTQKIHMLVGMPNNIQCSFCLLSQLSLIMFKYGSDLNEGCSTLSCAQMQDVRTEHWQQRKCTECSSLFFKEQKNIENRDAWFLAEPSKAKKGVQKDK
jgi:hypothetical protein